MKLRTLAAAIAAMVASVTASASPTYQATMTVAGYSGESTLADFPVLVRISPSTISGFDYSQCAANGADISFVDADGNVLSHEIDTWDTSGESLAWVSLPSLAANATFTMRWGDSAVTASSATSNTWNANYVGVWHMGEANGTCANSSRCGSKYDAAPAGDTANSVRYAGTDAPVGFARTTATSAARGYLSIPSYDAESVGGVFTMSGWVRLDSASGYSRLFSRKTYYTDDNGWETEMWSASYTKFNARGCKNDKSLASELPSMQASWVHVALVYDGATLTVYGNGGETVASAAIDAATDNAKPLSIGCDSDGNEAYIQGQFDECRLMKGAASADWVKAEYDTVKASGFLAYGEAESAPDAALAIGVPSVTGYEAKSATVSLQVRGASGEGKSATATLAYGTSADALDKSVSVGSIASLRFVELTATGLKGDTTYYAKVSATNANGESVESDVFSFKTTSQKKAALTVAGYSGESTLADFPVLVRISPSTISGFAYSQCATVGGEPVFYFTDAAGNVLPHEVDTWNPDGETLAWVKLTTLAKDVTFYLNWGDIAESAASNTWNANYVGVWHMGEASGTCANSSRCGSKYDAAPAGNTANSVRYAGTDAPVGFARTTATSAARGYLSVPSYDAESVGGVFTMSGWVRLDSASGYSRLFSRKTSYSDDNGWEVEMQNGSYTKFDARGRQNSKVIDGGTLPSMQKTWVHVALVYDGATLTAYGNGGEVVVSAEIDAATDNAKPLSIGCDSDGDEAYVQGQFDECRLMKGAASADWVKAEYDTVKTAGFLAYGEAESADEGAALSVAWAADVTAEKHTATVSARVLALGGGATSAAVSVRYGTTEGDLSQTAELAAAAGKGETVSATLTGLAPDATYYAKLVAKNDKGDESESDVISFKTETYLSNIALDGDGGDAIVVSGTLDAFEAGKACELTVLTGDSETTVANVWSSEDFGEGYAAPSSDGGSFSLSFCETDTTSPRYIAPGASVWVVVVAKIGDWEMQTPAQKVTTKSAKPAWNGSSLKLSCLRRSVSVDGYLSEVGMKGATTVTLYLGETTAYECSTNVVSADMETGHYSFFSDKPCKMPNFDRTYYWKLVAENVSEGGTVTNAITAGNTFQTKDVTTYTWTGLGDGSWNDANGWRAEEAYADDCLGCPTSVNATVVFEAGTTNVITLATPVQIAKLDLSGAAANVTFKAAEVDGAVVTTNDAKITVTDADYSGASVSLTLDGVALLDNRNAGYACWHGTDFALTLLNGSDFYSKSDAFEYLNGGKLTLRGGSTFSVGSFRCGCDVEIDDSMLTVRGYCVFGVEGTASGTLAVNWRFAGKAPRCFVDYDFSAEKSGAPTVNFEFLVPDGGYAATPIYSTSPASAFGVYMGQYANATFNMNVSADSPAKKVGRKLETTLVEWPAGISTTVVKEGAKPSKSDVFVWSEDLVSGLYPKSLGVKFTNGPGLMLIIR